MNIKFNLREKKNNKDEDKTKKKKLKKKIEAMPKSLRWCQWTQPCEKSEEEREHSPAYSSFSRAVTHNIHIHTYYTHKLQRRDEFKLTFQCTISDEIYILYKKKNLKQKKK